MYLNNNSKFSDDDRYASFNISNKNTLENFTQVSNWKQLVGSETLVLMLKDVMMEKS